MEITLTPEQEAFIRRAVGSGRFDRAEDAVAEALLLWEGREVVRSEFRVSLDEARSAITRGEGRAITQESTQQLAGETKRRLRARLAAEQFTDQIAISLDHQAFQKVLDWLEAHPTPEMTARIRRLMETRTPWQP